MNKRFLISVILFNFFFLGCTHNLRITNLDDYFSPSISPLREPLKIGVSSNSNNHIQNSKYIAAIVDALQRTGSFERIIYPYNQSTHGGQVDIIVDINIYPHYSGRGSNFFVNWPGFLIFVPVIWGYGYIANIETEVTIKWLKEGHSQHIVIPAKYNFRQAEIDRTWTEIGWLELGIIPLIGGFVFIQYDPDVTDEFISKVSHNYGAYIAKKILGTL